MPVTGKMLEAHGFVGAGAQAPTLRNIARNPACPAERPGGSGSPPSRGWAVGTVRSSGALHCIMSEGLGSVEKYL
jgi:hypothetical protein